MSNNTIEGYIVEAKSINPEHYHRFVEGLTMVMAVIMLMLLAERQLNPVSVVDIR